MKPVISMYTDGDTTIVVLPSYSLKGYGQVMVKVEKLGDDLFVAHECGVTAIDLSLTCGCVEAAVQAYLAHTQDVYDDIVLEHHRVVLTPDMLLNQIY